MDQGLEQDDTNTKDTLSLSTEPAKKSVRFEHHATEDDSTDQEEPTTTSNTERNGNPKDPVADVPPTHDIAQTELETDGKSNTPETGQQTEETPRQQPDAQPDQQTRRYPLRIRRNRFALASTLLCGLLTTLTMKPEFTQAMTSNGMAHHPTWRYPAILLATLHLGPIEGVATATTMAHGTIWWSTALLLATFRPQPVEGTREVKLSNYGVIFQSLGERFFSDSEWTVVTDISFDHGDKMTKELKRSLTEKSILPTPPAVPSGYNIVERPSVNEGGKPFKSNSGVMPNTEKIQYMIAALVRERAIYELTRLETIEKDYFSLKTSLQQNRQKRGMVDGGGRILNWLFGVSTTEELDKVNNQVEKLSTETTAIVHADWKTRDKIDKAFRSVDLAIEWLQQLVSRLSNGLAYAAMDKLSPALFQPTQLQTVITDIKNNMPSGWTLTPAIQAGDMWRSYQEAKVTKV